MPKNQKEKRKFSIWWKLLLVVVLTQIPFCGFFAYSASETVDNVNQQLAESQLSTLRVFRNTIQKQLENAETYLYTQCWGTAAFAEAAVQTDPIQARKSLSEIVLEGQRFLDENRSIEFVTFFLPESESCWLLLQNGESENAEIEALVRQHYQNTAMVNCGWSLCSMEKRSMLIRLCGYEDGYAMVGIDLERLALSARADFNMPASIVFRSGDKLITEALWTRECGGTLTAWRDAAHEWYFVDDPLGNDRYQITEISFAGLTMCMGTLYQYDWTWMYMESFLLMGVVVLTMIMGMLYLRKAFFLPLSDLVNTMIQIRNGKRPSRAFQYRSQEFASIQESFNSMVDALEQQRITSYENELKANRAEMQALRLQIRRHFFLNCLKNIYAMTNTGDLENIRQTVLLLSTNLRYTLDFYKDSVELEKELRMCEKYVQLQGIGQAIFPILTVEMDPKLRNFPVPPVSILTMLENCCKYGSRQDQGLRIRITAACRHMDEQNYVCIAVQDNGLGFPEEMIYKLNNDLETIQQEGHVGIVNTMTRIRMLYGKKCEVLFSNRGGARVEWIIPVENMEGDWKMHEIADCG